MSQSFWTAEQAPAPRPSVINIGVDEKTAEIVVYKSDTFVCKLTAAKSLDLAQTLLKLQKLKP